MKKVVVDTSFLINMHILGTLDQLCKIFDCIYISPSVWDESKELQPFLEKLNCVQKIFLTEKEKFMERELHSEFAEQYGGKHHGEIESLVIAVLRKIPIVLCDNFAPWYLQRKKGKILSETEIARGFFAIEQMLVKGLISPNFIKNLEGIYPKKNIQKLMERFQSE